MLNTLLELQLFGIDLIDVEAFLKLIVRFVFNMSVILFIVRYLYYENTKRKDYLFTYILIAVVVFLLCFLLENVKLRLGFALGLFAIFGILRYRTSQIEIKEMTYLFTVIGLSVVNALANKKISYAELIFSNVAVITIIYILEKMWLLHHESSKTITYEKIENIKPENRTALIEDLKERTGLNINRVEVGRINFLRDTARVRIYYFEDNVNAADDEQDYRNNGDD